MVSCGTMPTCASSESCLTVRISTPSITTLPCDGIVKARDQVDQRGFARAGRAEDGHRLARARPSG